MLVEIDLAIDRVTGIGLGTGTRSYADTVHRMLSPAAIESICQAIQVRLPRTGCIAPIHIRQRAKMQEIKCYIIACSQSYRAERRRSPPGAYIIGRWRSVREQRAGRAQTLHTTMVSLQRTIRSLRRVGFREWWRQMQYIGDAKSGRFVGKDQCVAFHLELVLRRVLK